MAHVFFTGRGRISAAASITFDASSSGNFGVFNSTSERLAVTFTVDADLDIGDASQLNNDEFNHHESAVFTGGGANGADGTLIIPPGRVYFLTWSTGSGADRDLTIATDGVATSHGPTARLAEETGRVFFWEES